ncbi:MAG: FAD-binding oxidoreductase, partial [Rhodospirillales bacterium]
MLMPKPDKGTIAKRDEIIRAMQSIVSDEGVITNKEELRAYDCDGLMAYKQVPLIVVLPESTAEVSKVLKYCFENDVKIVPRGSGTGLSGGALPLADGITLGLGKFNKVL